ncbi:hypothetical protein [Streptomyces hypolithicus]
MSAAARTAAPPAGAQKPAVNAEQAGRRIEEVLDRLAATGDRDVCAAAEELVRVLMDFYGAALARIVEPLTAPADRGAGPLAKLLDDQLVASLLVLHDLHPEDTGRRIERALATVREHPVELVGFDESTGTLRLRSSAGGGCGCSSTAGSAQEAVESALACFAPEVTTVDLAPAAAAEPALLQIRTGPPTGPAGHAPAPAKAP